MVTGYHNHIQEVNIMDAKKVLFFRAWNNNWCFTHAYLQFVADNMLDIQEDKIGEENTRAFLYNVAHGYISDKRGGVVDFSVINHCWYCSVYGEVKEEG
jgi:hypothetical protein